MQRVMAWTLAGLAAAALASSVAAQSPEPQAQSAVCTAGDGGLPVSRVVEIDTSGGPLFGNISKQVKEDSFLKPKEVVLTFDDGPMPWVTSSILDTLDKFCTKATFFSVGKMAIAYPSTLRKVVERGHTLGGHTFTHPLNLKRLKLDKAMAEIERGMAAIALVSGGKAVPFFRFPGLSDNAPMLDALQKRGIATFSVDVVSDDSYISSPAKLIETTISRVEAHKGGILLFHDIKPATAKALPTILSELKRRGYSVVHMRARTYVQPLPEYADELKPVLAKKDPPQGPAVAKAAMLPFYGSVGPERITPANGLVEGADVSAAASGVTVDQVAPAPRNRTATVALRHEGSDKAAGDHAAASAGGKNHAGDKARAKTPDKRESHSRDPNVGEAVTLRGYSVEGGWSAQVRRDRFNRTYFD